MSKKLLVYAALPVLGLGLLGMTGVASAHGFGGFGFGMFGNATPDQIASRQDTMFQQQASLLGISVDDVKAAWAKGVSFTQLAQDHGITQDQLKQRTKDASLAQLKANLQALVDRGVITQTQADARLAFMQTQTANGKGKGRGHGMMR